MMTLTYGFGVALAAFAGVLAAPIYQVNPLMGSDLIIVVFAIVVIGGMGSILGSIVTGLGLGIVEGLTKVFYAEASSTVIFVIMAIVLLIRPAGLFGRTALMRVAAPAPARLGGAARQRLAVALAAARAAGLVAPFVVYPIFLMKALCFALFACAFNLLLGYVGLLVVRPRRVPRLGGLRLRAQPPRSGAGRRSSRSSPAPRPRPLLGLVFGWLAIRRTGIYFAMITLALAQMTYFFALQAPFTGGEDGIQAIPRGHLFGVIDLGQHAQHVLLHARGVPVRLRR